MPRLTESKAKAAPLPKGDAKQTFLWCSEVRGFGVRTTANGSRAYVVQTKVNGKPMRRTLGAVGVLAWEGTEDVPGALDLAKLALQGARRGTDMATSLGKAAAHTFTLQQAWDAWKDAGFPAQGRGAQEGKFKRAVVYQDGQLQLEKPRQQVGQAAGGLDHRSGD